MTFQLGVVDFLINEMPPRTKNRDRALSLARHGISTPLDELAGHMESRGFPIDLSDVPTGTRATTKQLFKALGFERYDDIDFTPDDGCTIIHDMNRPLPQQYHHQFDLVFEMGTIEHIFDVRSTFANIVAALKIGGLTFHLAPLNFINHGFFNLSPTLFHDVYRANGFSDFSFFLLEFPLKWWKNQHAPYRSLPFTPDPMKVKTPKGYFLMVGFCALKTTAMEEFKIPTQAIYDSEYKKDGDHGLQ